MICSISGFFDWSCFVSVNLWQLRRFNFLQRILPLILIKNENIFYIFATFRVFFDLVVGILFDNVLQIKQSVLVLFYFLFLMLIFFNVCGLLPFTFTVTSSFAVTLFFSSTIFIAVNIINIFLKG